MSSSYRLSLNNWLANLDVKAERVLDIGGSQEQVKNRVKSWDVKEYQIADLANPHKDSPQPEIILDLNEGGCGLEEDIDLVFCLEVFDYVWNPYEAFAEIERVLKPGGIAWVSFPTVYPHHQPIQDDALRYMQGGIQKLANATGLTIEEIIPRRAEDFIGLDTWYRSERMRAAKHFDHNVTGFIVRFSK